VRLMLVLSSRIEIVDSFTSHVFFRSNLPPLGLRIEMTTPASRVVVVPKDVTLWQQDWTSEGPRSVGITQITPNVDPAGESKTYTLLQYGVLRTLYIPLVHDQSVNDISAISSLITSLAGQNDLNKDLHFYSKVGSDETKTLPEGASVDQARLSFAPGITLYVPYGFLTTTDTTLTPKVTAMREAANILPPASSTIATVTTVSTDGGASAGTGGAGEAGPAPTSSSGSSTSSSISSSISSNTTVTVAAAPTSTAGTITQTQLNGAAAGGVVGGFFAGAFICALLIWLFRRHKRQKRVVPRYSRHDESIPGHVQESKEMRDLAIPMSVTGWQKHLPQEKDDGTIARTVKTVFDQVQVHMEGFYKPRSEKLTEEAMAAIKRISPPDLARKLGRAPDSVSLLEAILVRWIVQRMSLRSVAAESFLPAEYTKIPEQNGWHMENDENGNVHAAEVKKGQ
jgi:hypothetical protein